MSDPCKSIPNDKDQKELDQGEPNKQASDKLKNGQSATNDMEPSAGKIGMLGQVKRVKFFKSIVLDWRKNVSDFGHYCCGYFKCNYYGLIDFLD
jgi:hypothetical protein